MSNPGIKRHAAYIVHYTPMFPRIIQLSNLGYTQREIADILNEEGRTMLDGSPFNQVQICRLLKDARRVMAPPTVTKPGAALAAQANENLKTPTAIERQLEMMRRIAEQQTRQDEQLLRQDAESRQRVEIAPPIPSTEFSFPET